MSEKEGKQVFTDVAKVCLGTVLEKATAKDIAYLPPLFLDAQNLPTLSASLPMLVNRYGWNDVALIFDRFIHGAPLKERISECNANQC